MRWLFFFVFCYLSQSAMAGPQSDDSNVYYLNKKANAPAEAQANPRLDLKPIEYFMEITPESFLNRISDRPLNWYMNSPIFVSDQEAKKVLEYILREELYKHDTTTLEAVIRKKFEEKPQLNFNKAPAIGVYQIDLNFKYGYHILKNFDLLAYSNYSERARLGYLTQVFKQPRGLLITSTNNDLLKDFVRALTNPNIREAVVEEHLKVAQLAIEYYRNREALGDKTEAAAIRKELIQISRGGQELSTYVDIPFYNKLFANVHKEQLNRPQEKDLISEDLDKQIAENKAKEAEEKQKRGAQDLLKSAFLFIEVAGTPAFNQKKSSVLTYKDSKVQLEYAKHYLTESHNNVTSFPAKNSGRRIYTIHVVSPGVHASEAVYLIAEALLKNEHIYGVYFDNKIKIPSKLDPKTYEVSTIGNSRVLIRKIEDSSLACPKLF